MSIHEHTEHHDAHSFDADAWHAHRPAGARIRRHGLGDTWLKAAVMGATGFYLLFLLVSGTAVNYINPAYAPLTYLAAALLIILAAVAALDGLRSTFSGHAIDHISWVAVAIVSIPVLLGVVVPSRPLGASDAEGRVNTSVAPASGGSSLPSSAEDWNVLDWLTALRTADDPSELNGLSANLEAFVKHSEDYPPEHFMAIRIFISCCVVDGVFAGIPVQWEDSADLPNDSWVRVKGKVNVGEFNGETLPIIVASAVEVSEEDPEQPYLYR